MYNSFSYKSWLADLTKSVPDSLVLSSKNQSWKGLEVALLRSNRRQVVIPANSSYLIVIHLDRISNCVGKIDRQIYKGDVREGETSILSLGVDSEWQWQQQGQCSCLHLALDAAFVSQIAQENEWSNANQIEILPQFLVRDSQIQHIGLALLAELKIGGLSGHLFAESLTTALAARLLQQFSLSKQQICKPEGGLSKQKLSLVIEYINDRLDEELRLIDIAANIDISSSHFTRLFKQSTGTTPYQYVIQCRVERAKLLLQQRKLTIAEVATMVGFHDQSHLTYHFKRILGTTPKRFLQH
ncbi:MAG: AraC family transcriptional regulator [Pleurocapsa sp. MO_226.B13]|nr:AraC family transcriptional regulator [Pleurocapsa sp. MO_226.B13]